MVKLIRNNQKTVLAGLTILSTLIFVLSPSGRGSGGGVGEIKIGTINGKTVYSSEFMQARNELSALQHGLTFTEEQEERDPKVQLIRGLLARMSARSEMFPLLRHEAIADNVLISEDDVNGMMATYTHEADPDSVSYLATRAGVTDLLKIIARYDQLAAAVKISKPLADLSLIERAEDLQLDLIQFKAVDFADKVPPPTTQQVQDQFTKFADQAPHHPVPTTNPFGFGYRLPVRAKMDYIYVSPDAVTATVVATKSAYDWEVQARKYFLSHLDEFMTPPPSTAPTTTASTEPIGSQKIGPLPFEAVHDKILTSIRKPLVTALSDQIQGYLSSTLNSDWQAYSQVFSTATTEPASSLGVAYTSFDYLNKLVEKVQSRFKVTIIASQTPSDLPQDQIATLPQIGTATVAESAITQATAYLDLMEKKAPTAAAQLTHPSAPLQGAAESSTVFFRLTDALPSIPAPNLAAAEPQVSNDVRSAAAYQLALEQAKALAANAKGLPLDLASSFKAPTIHLAKLSMDDRDVPEIKPELGDATASFTKQAFQLLGSYDPHQYLNSTGTIELPEQSRAFAAQLKFVNAHWNAQNFVYATLAVRDSALRMEQEPLMSEWFDFDAVSKRLNYKPIAKNPSE